MATISCDGIAPGADSITVCASLGAGDGGSDDGIRQTLAGAGRLGYLLYQSDLPSRWGGTDDASLGDPYRIDAPVSGTTPATTRRLYGTVPRGQATVPVGIYDEALGSADAVFTYAEFDLDCSSPAGRTRPGPASQWPRASSQTVHSIPMTSISAVRGSSTSMPWEPQHYLHQGAEYEIGIDGGGTADPARYALCSGSNTVRYGLCSDPGRGSIWGTATGSVPTGVEDGARRNFPICGRVQPQPAVAGAYSDTVVVTITYYRGEAVLRESP